MAKLGDMVNASITNLKEPIDEFESEFESINERDEIIPNLWLGSHPSSIHGMKYVFAMNGSPTYLVQNGQMVICRPFEDAPDIPDENMLHDVARMVLRYSKLGPTLVHCAAGINRSALIVALALIYDGMAAADAIAMIRKKRSSMCLSNDTFETWLLEKSFTRNTV